MKTFTIFLITFLIATNVVKSQDIYRASSLEMIFSFANVNDNNTRIPVGMRYTAFFHTQQTIHVDFNNSFGVFTGLGIRNIGINTTPDSVYFHGDKTYYKRASVGASVNQLTNVKQRTYTVGLPIALKIGNFDNGWYLFAGGEYEYSFHYKEKVWIDGKKKKYREWFGNEVTQFLPSVFAGVKLRRGIMVNFKWYLQNFMNTKHKADLIEGNTIMQIKPYENLSSQLFYVSVAFTIDNRKPKAKPIDTNPSTKTNPKIDM